MPVPQSTLDLITRFDNATNEVAKDLKDLRDQLASATTAADVDALLAPVVARLEVLGEDPQQPVPPVEP